MVKEQRGRVLLSALWSSAWIFAIGFLGSEALFAPNSDGVAVEATLIPSALAALGTFAYRVNQVPEAG
jgi:hypothetical protein